MLIRSATLEDARLLAELSTHVQQLHVDFRPTTFRPANITDELIKFYTDLLPQPDSYFFVAENDRVAVGYVYVKRMERPDTPFTYAARFLHVDQISVNPDARGKGYGKALMAAVYKLAEQLDIHRITLDVWMFNANAVEFYDNLGFTPFMQRMEIALE